jgi:hypothetical protein
MTEQLQQELDVTKLAQELISKLENEARSVPYIVRGIKLLHEAILQASTKQEETTNG